MNFYSKLKAKVRDLKKEIYLLRIAYSDQRTPWFAKLMIGLTVGYLLSPIDLIPDFIPVLGILDDLILVPILITISIKMIPDEVINDARNLIENQPEKLKKNNWWVAGIIILIWVLAVYLIWMAFRS